MHEGDSQEGEWVRAGREARTTPPFRAFMYDESVCVRRKHRFTANLDNGQPNIGRCGIDERANLRLRYHYAQYLS
ncbi:hypothetical protein WS62_10335 [Burkholderia sp. ABCPW 14]|nr:hypothetical protein WS62_10335 [Burkholderia sp. ABCPW 14]